MLVGFGNGHIELVKLFLPIGVDVDLRSDVDVGTPLICVVDRSQEDAITAGDTVSDNYMLIHLAATSENQESAEVLLAVTPHIQSVRERTVDGVIAFMKS
ncbi:hypothetical protein KY285_011627 [Solanum tuberosum]|nr:hypothetical protein KY285_011627 [Solanum tuberosum]